MINLKRDFPKVALGIWASSILLIGISIHCFVGRPADMFWAVGLLVFSSVLETILIWHIAIKQMQRMDKGEKLAGGG